MIGLVVVLGLIGSALCRRIDKSQYLSLRGCPGL
jgi:hypothetical protein